MSNEKKKMASKHSLDEKLSDLVGSANLNLSNKFKINYNCFRSNYNDLNYNEIGSKINFGSVDFDFSYLQEKNT